jgi:predicted ATPase
MRGACKLAGGDVAAAEALFIEALNWSQEREAKSYELRAAVSLARLWQSQGRTEEARETLGNIYGWFTEGFDTPDLIEARALVDELN